MVRWLKVRFVVGLAVVGCGMCCAQAATAPPSITITAADITMPSGGTATIPFTLTAMNGFTGTIGVQCTAPVPAVGVKEPACYGGGPAVGYPLTTAAMTASGGFEIAAIAPLPTPAMSRLKLPGDEGMGWTLVAVVMLGVGSGTRRRRGQWWGHLLVVFGMLLGVVGLSGCGGPETLTPGTYTYTLTAKGSYGQNNAAVTSSTTVVVTVPAGVVVKQGVPVPI